MTRESPHAVRSDFLEESRLRFDRGHERCDDLDDAKAKFFVGSRHQGPPIPILALLGGAKIGAGSPSKRGSSPTQAAVFFDRMA